MKRFMTYVEMGDKSEELKALGENENWQDVKAEEFVWQFAPDKETALKQHDEKFIAWRTDVNTGREQKPTY